MVCRKIHFDYFDQLVLHIPKEEINNSMNQNTQFTQYMLYFESENNVKTEFVIQKMQQGMIKQILITEELS